MVGTIIALLDIWIHDEKFRRALKRHLQCIFKCFFSIELEEIFHVLFFLFKMASHHLHISNFPKFKHILMQL